MHVKRGVDCGGRISDRRGIFHFLTAGRFQSEGKYRSTGGHVTGAADCFGVLENIEMEAGGVLNYWLWHAIIMNDMILIFFS